MIGHLRVRKSIMVSGHMCLLGSGSTPFRLEDSVSAEFSEKAGLGARHRTRRAGHAATSSTTAHSETGQEEEDHGSKGDPEALMKHVIDCYNS